MTFTKSHPLTGNTATATVTCIESAGFSPTVISFIFIALCIFDDACSYVWRGFGAAPGLRHAAIVYIACTLAGVTDPSTLLLAIVAAACWPCIEYDSPPVVIAWIVAWAVPIVGLFGGAHADQTALCFIIVEWMIMLIDAAADRSPRRRAILGMIAEIIVAAWFLGPGDTSGIGDVCSRTITGTNLIFVFPRTGKYYKVVSGHC